MPTIDAKCGAKGCKRDGAVTPSLKIRAAGVIIHAPLIIQIGVTFCAEHARGLHVNDFIGPGAGDKKWLQICQMVREQGRPPPGRDRAELHLQRLPINGRS